MIFDLDETSPDHHGAQRLLGSEIIPPGDYILLRRGEQPPLWFYDPLPIHCVPDGGPLPVALTEEGACPRQPTHSDTPAQVSPLLSTYRMISKK